MKPQDKPKKEKPKPQGPPLLDCSVVAEWLGVSMPTLSRMIRAKRIPFVLLGTGKKKMLVRFRQTELELWLDRRSRGAVPRSHSNLKQVDKRNGDSAQHIEKEKVAPFLQTRIVQVCKEWPKVKKNPKTVQAGLIADLGGIEHLSTAQQILIELLGRDLYLLDETDQRIVQVCKEWPKVKKNPKTMATLYGYRQPITAAISKNLAALGLEKRAPAAKSLEEILNEPDHDQPEPE